ncbi:MAG: hypothetical protein U0800_02395 [Isosphaeraceae bacterium]
MLVKFVDDFPVFDPPAFRDVKERMAEVAVEARKHPQTGPKTEEGKDRSKRNSTRHGLAGKGVVLPENVQVEADAMIAELTAKYRPVEPEDFRLIRDCAVGYARQYEAITQQTLLLTHRSEAAATDWSSHVLVEVEEVAAKLRRNPGLAVAQLRKSTPGTLWLIRQWKLLDRSLTDHGDWTAEEQELAQDLCGLLPRLRGNDPLRIQRGTLDGRKALVRKKIRGLRSLLGEGRSSLEQLERMMVIEGFIPLAGTEYRRLKRYEREARNLCQRALQALEARRLERQAQEQEQAERPASKDPFPPAMHLPQVAAPRPPRPLLTCDDVIQAITGPNPPARLMERLEKEHEEEERRRKERAAASAPRPQAESAKAPEPSKVPHAPEGAPPAAPIVEDGPRKKAPRDHELDAEALKRREQRRLKRKSRKQRR